MKRTFSVFICLIFIIGIFTSCSSKNNGGGDFIMNIGETPSTLDPQIISSHVEKLIAANCFEGLVRIDENGGIENGVASSYSISPDSLKYTFTLREDAKWHIMNGFSDFLGDDFEKKYDFRVTAYDFVFGIQRALDPGTKCPDAKKLYSIKNASQVNAGDMGVNSLGIKALNDKTLEITLEYPDENLLYSLCCPAAMPCKEAFWLNTNGKYGISLTYTLCNGPFYVSEWNDDVSVTLLKNPDYVGENEVKPASVKFAVNNDKDDIEQKVISNTYDVAFFTESQVAALKDESVRTQSFENIACSLIFNCSDEIFSNLNIRKAVCLSAQADNGSLPVNVSSLSSGIVPPFCTFNNENYRILAGKANLAEFSPSEAKQCFKKGLEEIEKDNISFTILCTEEYEETVRFFLQSWQKTLGIKFAASVDVKESGELLNLVKNGEYSVAFYPLEATEQEAINFLNIFCADSKENIINYSNKKYGRLISEANEGNDISLLKKCEDYLLDNAVVYPVFNQNTYFVTASNTSGIYFYSNSDTVFFINAQREN